MCSESLIRSSIPLHQQHCIVDGLIQYDNLIDGIVLNYLKLTESSLGTSHVKQWIQLIVLVNLFGLNFGQINSIICSDRAYIIKKYFLEQHSFITSRSWAYKHIAHLTRTMKSVLDPLIEQFQDYFYLSIGETARNEMKSVFLNGKQKTTPILECFIGIKVPSKIFPQLSVFQRGILIPYLNSHRYQHIKHISSIIELVGIIKTPEYVNNSLQFNLAGRLGFINKPPGINKFWEMFRLLDKYLDTYEKLVDEALYKEEVQDLTVTSVDCSNIPVDKRDKSATNGVGSQGSFFGQKTSIACGTYCLPINSVTMSGKSADVSLYMDTINPVLDMAICLNQDIWIQTAGAAYTSTFIIDYIEASGSIPIIDINPRASKLLKQLKNAANNLQKLSKKAIKNGLKKHEKKGWIDDVKHYVSQNDGTISINDKRIELKRILKNWANYARYHGLSKKEQEDEWKLRKIIADIRRKIRNTGTWAEKKIANTIVMPGTIEWFLIYHIRGQNEGINGILKKRGKLIGDGQHTTWKVGLLPIRNTIKSEIIMIKTSSLVYKMITGQKRNSMRRIYNWRVQITFIIIFQMDYVEESLKMVIK